MPDRHLTASTAAIAVLAVLLAFSPARVLAAGGDDLLRKAIVADDHVSYAGTITTLVYGPHGADATVVRVDHLAPNKWRMWYVAPADAYGRLIVSNEAVTYQYEPKLATVYSDAWEQSSPGITLELDVAKVVKNYTIEENPASDVAGRKSLSLSLVSKHTGTLVERVWLDAATKLVLERETYHSDGTIASKSSFDDVRLVKDLPKELFDLSVPAGMHVTPGATFAKTGSVDTLASSLNFSVVSPKYLPEGFTLEKASLASRDGIQSIELLYTDGLRDFSLFENSTERLPDLATSKAIDVGDASGVTTHLAGETLVSWNANGLNITMVGNLTSQELAKIGASIKP